MSIRHKRGANFRIPKYPLQIPDLTGWTITATAKGGATETALTVRKLDPYTRGEIELSAPASATADWPLRLLRVDVKCVLGSEVARTETFHINVLEEVTP